MTWKIYCIVCRHMAPLNGCYQVMWELSKICHCCSSLSPWVIWCQQRPPALSLPGFGRCALKPSTDALSLWDQLYIYKVKVLNILMQRNKASLAKILFNKYYDFTLLFPHSSNCLLHVLTFDVTSLFYLIFVVALYDLLV